MAARTYAVCSHRRGQRRALALVDVEDGSRVAGKTAGGVWAVAVSTGWMAIEAVSEGIHILASLAQAGVGHLEDSIGLALEAFSGERSCASLAGVVARHAAALSVHEETEVALASPVSSSPRVRFAGQACSTQAVQAGRAGVVAGVAVPVQVVHVVAGIAGAGVLLHDDRVRFAG